MMERIEVIEWPEQECPESAAFFVEAVQRALTRSLCTVLASPDRRLQIVSLPNTDYKEWQIIERQPDGYEKLLASTNSLTNWITRPPVLE